MLHLVTGVLVSMSSCVLPLFLIVVYRFVSSRKPFKEYLKFYSSFLFFYVNGFLGKPSLPDTGVLTIGLFFTLGMAQLFGNSTL